MAVERHQIFGRAIAKKEQEVGYSMKHTVFNQVLNGRYKSQIIDKKIRAFVCLAGVTEETVFIAAGRPAPGPPLANELPDGVDNLSPKARKAVIEMLGVLIAAEKGSDHDERTQEEVTKPGTQGTHSPAMSRAGVSPAHVDASAEGEEQAVPRPKDEYALAASDEPSEGRAMREQQDHAAEGSQDAGDWSDS